MTKVIQRAPVSGSELTCMIIMANWANDDGNSLYPSIALLAEAMRVSRSQAQRVLHRLTLSESEDATSDNWWFRVVANHKGGAPGMTRRYEMNVARLDRLEKLPEFAKAEERRQKRVATGRTHATGSAHATGRTSATQRVAPMRPDSSVEPSKERESVREGFEDFEKALSRWPSGFADSRQDALAAWGALSCEDRAEAAFEIDRVVTASRAIGRKHLCTFGRYLAERRWQALPARPMPASKLTGTNHVPGAPDTPPAAVKMKPTAFQQANPDLYPELFSKPKTEVKV